MQRTIATVLFAMLPLAATVGACRQTKGDPNDVGGARYAALESAAVTTPAEAAALREGHRLKTAFVIVMENHNWDQIRGNPSAPYINEVLLPASASAEAYRATPNGVRPSEPNYVWMEAGDNLAITDNDNPYENYRNTKKHLVSLLQSAAVPWKSYQQGIGGARCPLEDDGSGYQPKHNPMVFFTDVTEGNRADSANCIAHVRPVTELAVDLANGSVSGYVFITPDRCHNMHDACESRNSVKNGDTFLSQEVPRIQASSAYKDGGAIFVVWDENSGGDATIGLIVASPLARPGHRSHTPLNHSSLLRTMQEIFAVGPLLRDATYATSLREMFTAYP